MTPSTTSRTIILCATVVLIASASVSLGEGQRQLNPDEKESYTVPESQIVWGAATNFQRGDWTGRQLPATLRIGIRVKDRVIVLAGDPLKQSNPAWVYGESRSGSPIWTIPSEKVAGVPRRIIDPTNDFLAFLPASNERYEISMIDADGKPVSRTIEGEKLGQWPSLKRTVRSFRWDNYDCQCVSLYPYSDDELYAIEPSKLFTLRKPGMYKMTFVQRLYVVDTNTYLKPLELPPVSIDVQVRSDK